MTGDELITEVKLIVQDASFDEDTILGYINEGLLAVASVIDLPDLEELDTIDTSTTADHVALPSGYFRSISFIDSITNEVSITKPGRNYEYLKFRRRHPVADTGYRVTDVAVRAKELFYYPIPEAEETLRLGFIKRPTDIDPGSEPDCIPEHLHRPLLCSYAAMIIFSKIEDGIEGKQLNTDRQKQNFNTALLDLATFVGPRDREPIYIADEYDVSAEV